MALADTIVCTTILDLSASTGKVVVVERLLSELARAGHVSAADIPSLLDAVMRRERQASTAIGGGVAVPHTKHAAVTRVVGILGLCRNPVNFDSIDGRPTDIIILLLAPPSRPELYGHQSSRGSGALIRLLADEKFRTRLRQASTAEDITDLLHLHG